MTNINTFKIPDYEEMPFAINQDIDTAIPENATLVKKNEVKNATTGYKARKVGKIALFKFNDKLAA